MAEGTPLERVQVVTSGARGQIPPSPLVKSHSDSTNVKSRSDLIIRIDCDTRQYLDK